jgi:hypothetical protein
VTLGNQPCTRFAHSCPRLIRVIVWVLHHNFTGRGGHVHVKYGYPMRRTKRLFRHSWREGLSAVLLGGFWMANWMGESLIRDVSNFGSLPAQLQSCKTTFSKELCT